MELGPQFRINATPLFFVNYGDNEGKILISLIFENYRDNSKMKEVLAKVIIKLIYPNSFVSPFCEEVI